MPQLDYSKAFPPRFEAGILYPAIYNLDGIDMSTAPVGDVDPNIYFNLIFPGNLASTGDTPKLTFGKHMFEIRHAIAPAEYIEGDEGGYWNPDQQFPPLRPNSRILFEFKDKMGLVIYSDIIYNSKLTGNDGFRGYIWLKLDPLRTYDFITEGIGTATIVGETIVARDNYKWRGKYNVRTQFPIDITLTEPISQDDGSVKYIPLRNKSPLFMRYKPNQMGSGSENGAALFVSESLFSPDGVNDSYVVISSSKLETYGGRINSISLDFQYRYHNPAAGDSIVQSTDWLPVNSNIMLDSYSTLYENHIDSTYAQGLNPVSLELPFSGSNAVSLPPVEGDFTNILVRFRFRFKDSSDDNTLALNYYDPLAETFEILYPTPPAHWLAAGSASDGWFVEDNDNVNSDDNWLGWGGTMTPTSGFNYGPNNSLMWSSGAGAHIWLPGAPSIKEALGGIAADATGKVTTYGRATAALTDVNLTKEGGAGPLQKKKRNI